MPIYEYLCRNCNEKFSLLIRRIGASDTVQCPGCGAANMERLLSTFAYHKSQGTILGDSGTPPHSFDADYYKDSRNIGRWAEQRAKELGVELPAEVHKEIQNARDGKLPPSLAEQL